MMVMIVGSIDPLWMSDLREWGFLCVWKFKTHQQWNSLRVPVKVCWPFVLRDFGSVLWSSRLTVLILIF